MVEEQLVVLVVELVAAEVAHALVESASSVAAVVSAAFAAHQQLGKDERKGTEVDDAD